MFFYIFLLITITYAKVRVWVDCDPGVDDAMALILAAHNPDTQLIGVTTVFGNINLEKSTRNTLRILSTIGRTDVPVFQGASRAIKAPPISTDVFGEEGRICTQLLQGLFGVEQLKETFQSTKEGNLYDFIKTHSQNKKFTYVLLGAQTNFALLIQEHEDILDLIDQVVIMGGSRGKGNVTPNSEFNIYADPEAAQIVIRMCHKHNIKLVMIGLDITHSVLVLQSFIEKIRNINTKFAIWCSELLQGYQAADRPNDPVNAPMHDPVALYYAIHPEYFDIKRVFIDVETESRLNYGRTTIDDRGVFGEHENGYYCYDFEQEQIWEDTFQAVQLASERSSFQEEL